MNGESVLSVINTFAKKVGQTAKAVAKKSSGIAEITKLNMNISTEEDKVSKAYSYIGKVVYDAFQAGEDMPESFREQCVKLQESKVSIEKMKTKILELKNSKICPGCNEKLELDVAFCPKCGRKQEPE